MAALLLAAFLVISLFPTAGLAEDDPGEAVPVAESVPEVPPAEPEPEEQVEAQSVEETEWVPDVEIPDEDVPEALPALPEEQAQGDNTDEQIEPAPSEPADDNPTTDPPENSEDQVQAQNIDDDVKAMEAEKPEKNEEPEQDDPNKSDDSDDPPTAFMVTLEDYTCEYDGEEHWSDKTPVCEPSDETTTYAFAFSFEEEGEYTDDLTNLKQTDAGEYTIYVKAMNQAGEVVATNTAKLIISKREVTVKVDDCTAEYTGSELYGSKELVYEGLLEGHLATINYEPARGTEVDTYEGSFDEDSFKVVVKPINEEDPSEEEAAGEEITGEKEDTEEKDGESAADNEDDTPETVVTSNYTLREMTPGKLEITKSEVSISSADGTWTYDGNEHSKPEYTVLCGGETVTPDDDSGLVFTLPETGDKLTITEPAKVKNVSDTAEGNNAFSYELTNTEKHDVQKNYNVQKNIGTLTIIPLEQATVTITGNSDTKTYSGSTQSVSGYKYNVKVGETVIPSDDFTVTLAADKKAEAVGTDTGTYAMGLTKDDFTVTNPNYNNYNNIIVEYTDGVLTIQQLYVKVTITGHNDKAVYDGKEHSVSGYDVACNVDLYAKNLDSNINFTGNAYASRTNVSSSEREGTTYMGLKEDQFKNRNTNFNAQFEVVDGYQTIEKRYLSIKVKPQSYVYNGESQGENKQVYSDQNVISEKVEVEGLQGRDKLLSITLNGQQTEVGTYTKDGIALSQVKIGTDLNTSTTSNRNYEIHWYRGTMTITRAPLTIKVKPQSYPYNGKAQGEDNKTYTDPAEISKKVEVKGLQGKDKLLSITLNGQETEVGTYNNKDKEEGIALSNWKIGTDSKNSTNSNKNYKINWTRGTLTITEADSSNNSTGGSESRGSSGGSKTGGSSSGSGSSSRSSSSGSGDNSYNSYDYSSGNNYYSGGDSNTTNTAQAESAVVSYEVPLEIGVVNTGTGESYE